MHTILSRCYNTLKNGGQDNDKIRKEQYDSGDMDSDMAGGNPEIC